MTRELRTLVEWANGRDAWKAGYAVERIRVLCESEDPQVRQQARVAREHVNR